MSRKNKPKQFFEIISDQPMIVDTYKRLAGYYPADQLYFATTPEFVEEIKKIFPKVKDSNILIEPQRRDTGPAMGYAAARLFLKSPDEPLAFIPSDHYIGNIKKFIKTLKVAEKLILETGRMIDISIEPNFPSTILGYTKLGDNHQVIDGVDIYKFAGHTEKPDFETARKYLRTGNYLWHASYYMWTPRLFLDAYKKYAPEMYQGLEKVMAGLKTGNQRLIEEEYSRLEKISIDYAITEKMDLADVLIIKGDFGWSDVGSWDVLFDRLSAETDSDGNLLKGNCLSVDTKKTMVYGSPEKVTAIIGLSGMVVIDTKDALLICPTGKAQEVKKIIQKLKEEGLDQYA